MDEDSLFVIPKRKASFHPPKFATRLILGTGEATHYLYEEKTRNRYRSKFIVLYRIMYLLQGCNLGVDVLFFSPAHKSFVEDQR